MASNGVLGSRTIERQDQDIELLFNKLLTNANVIMERSKALGNYGLMYGGDRNVPEAAGYTITRQFSDYSLKYTYQNIAKRIVEAPGDSTWQEAPELRDGGSVDTPFIKTWKMVVNFGRDSFDEIQDQKSIWHYCRRVDHQSGVGSFAGLVLGIKDGALHLSDPLRRNSTEHIDDFLYLAPYDEANISVSKLGVDPFHRRYNLPLSYSLTTNTDVARTGSTKSVKPDKDNIAIDWTRVVHVADGLKNNEVFGTPRLEAVYDLLDDLLKVTAATGESAWQLMTRGLIASARDGITLPEDSTKIRAAMEKFMHEQMRVLELQGMDVTLTEGMIVDPTGVIKAIISLISATTGIPQRILVGSEAGHLASSQDEKNWSQRIMARQIAFAETVILRPLISRFIFVGILPRPESGSYTVHWPSQLLLTDLEKAELAANQMNALAAAVGIDKLPLISYLKFVLKWPDNHIKAVLTDKQSEQHLALIDFPTGTL